MSYGYSLDLRERVLSFIEDGHSQKEAGKVFKVPRQTIYNWLRLKAGTGHLRMRRSGQRCPSKLEEKALRGAVDSYPDYFGSAQWHLSCFKKVQDYAKRKTFLFKERDKIRRQKFLGLLASLPADKRLWVNECGVEEEAERPYGRALKGKRVYSERSGKIRHARTTVIAAYRRKKMQAPFRFKGHTNTAVFNAWVGQCLVPILKKDDWVILDNGDFHKSPQTRKAIEDKGANLLFLPPYSPDLNEIEPKWANLKARIRKDKYSTPDFLQNLDQHLIHR